MTPGKASNQTIKRSVLSLGEPFDPRSPSAAGAEILTVPSLEAIPHGFLALKPLLLPRQQVAMCFRVVRPLPTPTARRSTAHWARTWAHDSFI